MTTCLIDAPLGENSLVTFKNHPKGRTLTLSLDESPADRSRAEALVPRCSPHGLSDRRASSGKDSYLTLLLTDDCGRDL